jgi:SAM-dependent methyltransferase
MDSPDKSASAQDYPEAVYSLLANIETRHFWFTERNRLILSTLHEVLGPLAGRTVLDVGCGTGFVTAALERAGMLACGLEMHMPALRVARARTRLPLICETAARVPFKAQFDAALLCDVIEHVPDDVLVLREASSALRPGGKLLVTVPAHGWLWSPTDDASGHKRRYSRRGLTETVERAGLRVRLARYFNALLLPFQVAYRMVVLGNHRRIAEPETLLERSLMPPSEPLNALLGLAMRADVVLSRLPVTFGTSIIAVCDRA